MTTTKKKRPVDLNALAASISIQTDPLPVTGIA